MVNELFEETNISKSYIKLSMPLVFSMVITMVYNLADTYFVAATNNTNLVAGVSLGAPIFTLLMAIGNIFGQGGSSLISRLLGKEKKMDIRCVSSYCFYISIIIGVIIGIVMLIFHVPILHLLGANSETFSYASQYYICLAIGTPFIVVSFIHTNLLRTEGMAKESMIGTVGGAIVNIILDPIFISFMGMGAAGAAIATVLGYLFSDIYCFIIVLRKSNLLSIYPSEAKISIKNIQQILGIGISAALTNIMQSISLILTNQFLLPYGNDRIAAMGISIKISLIVLLILTGLAFGGQPLFGYFYGANNKKQLLKLVSFCIKFVSAISIILTIIVFTTAPFLVSIFLKDSQIIKLGTTMLRLQVISMLFVGIILLITVIFQSAGKTITSLILSISRQGVVFIIVLLIASAIKGYYGVLATQAIADVLTGILAMILFYKQFYKKLNAD